MARTCVVGAGVSGLTSAYRLLDAGDEVVVLEKEPIVGGLCRSYRYDGFTYDVGPHRLFSARDATQAYFLEILGDRHTVTSRDSLVRLKGKYLTWPLDLATVLRLPLRDTLMCARDLLHPGRNGHGSFRNLEEYVVSRYGKTIYEIFWQGYTEKFLGLPCDRIDAAWGQISVGRSVVDRKAEPSTLAGLMRSCLVRRPRPLTFLYPDGGMDAFPRQAAERVQALGGAVLTGQDVSAFERRDGRIRAVVANGTVHPVDRVVWTGRLPDVCRLAGVEPPAVNYLSTLLFNVAVNRTLRGRWQWIYYSDPDCLFSRVSRPSRFSETTAPPGKTGLCVEISCREGDARWNDPESLREPVMRDLVKTGLVADGAYVEHCRIERVADTYPIYEKGFQPRIEAARQRLAEVSNLHLVGRQAAFVHDNIDEAVESAADLAAELAHA